MKFTSTLTAGLLVAGAAASPTKVLQPRATKMCGQWDSVQTGSYTLYNNLWGQGSGTGSQCTTYNSLSGNSINWSTSWSWSGGQYNVKSYANVVTKQSQKALSAIKSIPSTWSWNYSGSSIIANVAYDLFTGTSASGSAQYEIMIWLGALGGAGPISSTGQPIATGLSLGGQKWKLYKGPNGQMTVFSFVRDSGDVKSFNGNLMDFVGYLTKSQGLPTSQILQSVGAGTEPFTGSNAVFSTSAYSCSES